MRLLLDILECSCDGLPRFLPALDVLQGLCPPIKSRLADRRLLGYFSASEHLKEECIYRKIVWLELLWKMARNLESIEVKLPNIATAVFNRVLGVKHAARRRLC